jgi:RsiW-degrading membrane proteinase PrsW (M82 family)
MAELTSPTAGGERSRSQRLIALALLGVLALNYPLLAVFTDARLFLGIPVFYLYLFFVWGTFILLCALVLTGHATGPKGTARRKHGESSG